MKSDFSGCKFVVRQMLAVSSFSRTKPPSSLPTLISMIYEIYGKSVWSVSPVYNCIPARLEKTKPDTAAAVPAGTAMCYHNLDNGLARLLTN